MTLVDAYRDPERVIDAVCQAYPVTREELLGSSRAHRIAWARQVTCYLMRNRGSMELERIGEVLGRDHSTVHHANQHVERRLRTDSEARAHLDRCTAIIEGDGTPRPFELLSAARALQASCERLERIASVLAQAIEASAGQSRRRA